MTLVTRVTPYAVRVPRDHAAAIGTAGSPAPLQHSDQPRRYHRASAYGTVYGTELESTLVSIETDDGRIGWGETQAPLLPEVSAAIIDGLLGPMAVGEPLPDPEAWWDVMYDAMRVRGHHGGFYVDAMAGIDLALWDLAAQRAGRPLAALLHSSPRVSVPLYISGLSGATPEAQAESAERHARHGASAFKLFLGSTERDLLTVLDMLRDRLPSTVELFVDALWRLDVDGALRFADELAERRVGWLEAPLPPEDLEGHRRLAASAAVPIALGESYRTTFEIAPFIDARAVHILQPDLGRTGITGARRWASLAADAGLTLAPHVSIGFGPQIAAAAHFAAACPGVRILETNPAVYDAAGRLLAHPLTFDAVRLELPDGSGLGIHVDRQELLKWTAAPPGAGRTG